MTLQTRLVKQCKNSACNVLAPNKFLLIAQSIPIDVSKKNPKITCHHYLNTREEDTQYASCDIA
jgi:hypothetical protein